MRPMRGFGGFGFPSVHSMAAKLAIAMVAGSVLHALTRDSLGALLILSPIAVLEHFAVWQPFTYTLIAPSVGAVLFGGLILWSIGGSLEQVWGPRRLLWVVVGCTVLAGFLTVLLALLFPSLRRFLYAGGTVMPSVVWIAYGLMHGRGQTNFWGIPLTGHAFAGLGLGVVLLQGVFSSFLVVLPDLLGIALVFAYLRGANPRMWWLRLQHWRVQRQLKGRRSHLQVVDKDRDKKDQYLN